MNNKQTNNKKKKHKKLLAIFLPIGILGIGGGTVGGLFAAGVFNANKTNIANVFNQDSTHWKSDITPIVTTGGYTGAGYVWNTTLTPVNTITENDLVNWLKQYSDTTANDKTVIDNIYFTIPAQSTNSWIQVNVQALPHSRGYEGSFYFYVYYQGADHGILSNDFTSTNIDATSLNTQSISITSLFALIKNANANLDTNAIKLQYDSDDTATENWTNWDISKEFGIGSTTIIDQDNSLLTWDIASDSYIHIRLAPGGITPDYYQSSTPVNFTLKLYRPEIKDVSTWQESWNGQFYSAPNSNSFLTRFDSQYYAYPWFNGKLDGDLETTYSFANIDANKGTFIISGNPFYKTITSSTSDTDYDFNWSYYNKVDVSTFIVRNDDSPINDLNDVFYGQPNVQDVIQALKNRIKSTYVNTISWNQIDITITSSSISLKGTSSSICYTTAEKTISYTLKT